MASPSVAPPRLAHIPNPSPIGSNSTTTGNSRLLSQPSASCSQALDQVDAQLQLQNGLQHSTAKPPLKEPPPNHLTQSSSSPATIPGHSAAPTPLIISNKQQSASYPAGRYPNGAPVTPSFPPPPPPPPPLDTSSTATNSEASSPKTASSVEHQSPISTPVSPPKTTYRSMLDIGDNYSKQTGQYPQAQRSRLGSSASASSTSTAGRLTLLETLPTTLPSHLHPHPSISASTSTTATTTLAQSTSDHNRDRVLARAITSPDLITTAKNSVAPPPAPTPSSNPSSSQPPLQRVQTDDILVKPEPFARRPLPGVLPSTAYLPLPDRAAPYRGTAGPRQARPPVNRQQSSQQPRPSPQPSPAASRKNSVTDKKVLTRVGSFFGKKNRADSPPHDERAQPAEGRILGSNGLYQTSGLTLPRRKKHGSMSSTTSQVETSRSGTPPSPRSRAATFDDDVAPDQLVPMQSAAQRSFAQANHGNSVSHDDVAEQHRQPAPRIGITWAPTFDTSKEERGRTPHEQSRDRRRSISQDDSAVGSKDRKHLFPRHHDREEEAVALRPAFSMDASEGVGLKSRRMSTVIPTEFFVDSYDLSRDFVPSSHMPFSRGRAIGKGATAVVRLMHRKNDTERTLYAVKEYRPRDSAEPEAEYLMKVKSEYSIAHSLVHPNIVRSISLCTSSNRWNNVMEYCQYGELFHWVEKGVFKKHFTLEDRNCFFKQLLRGVDYLHAHGIAHRDIKLENLLLSSEGYLKITDFGVSDVFSGQHPGLPAAKGKCGQKMGDVRRCAPGVCGSMPYIAPEVLQKKGDYDPRALDVWSCAIVYVTMTYGGGPWTMAKPDEDSNYKKYKEGWDKWLSKHPDQEISDTSSPELPGMFDHKNRNGLWAKSSPAMKRLILKMLHPNPNKRIDIHSAVTSSLIRGLECCAPETTDSSELTNSCDCTAKTFKKTAVLKKHKHIPPKDHKTPDFLRHRFDMGHGYS